MQNRFGFKDFLTLTLLFALLIMLFLSMKQDDRKWDTFLDSQVIISEQSAALQRQASALEAFGRSIQDQNAEITNLKTQIEQALIQQSESMNRQAEAITRLAGSVNALIEGGVRIDDSASPGGSGLDLGDLGSGATSLQAAGRDESWARDGVAITYPEPFAYPSPPEEHPDFQPGGEFFELFEAQPPKLTPYLYSDVYGRRIVDGPVCESLAAYDPATLELRGLLAEAWQYDPNGMWLRVKIRDEARFSDGEPLGASDVKFTFDEVVFNAELQTERFRSTLNVIEKVEVIEDKVVEFTFRNPTFTNLREATRFVILPEHVYSQFTPSQLNQSTGLLMGSGPYRLQTFNPTDPMLGQWAPPQDIVLVRNENYWGRRPPIDRFRYKTISEYSALLVSLKNGTGDMMRGTPEQFRTQSRDPEFLEEFTPMQWPNMRSGFSFLAWNCGERDGKPTPFTDARVRRAMTHLLDRDRILRDFYDGLGEIATSPFPYGSPQNNPDITPHQYNVEKAKALLDEAGWIDRDGDGWRENERGDRFTFQYTHSKGSTISPKVGDYLRRQCRAVGIECVPTPIEWAIFSTVLDNRDFDVITMQWSQSHPESDPNQLWHSDSIRNQGDNFSQWANEEADRLIELGRVTIDDEERMKIWHQLHTVLHEEQPYTFMVNPPWIRFVRDKIQNIHPYNIGLNKFETFVAEPY
jgi:peptide/nickel transport system substrate-binding protein